MKEMQTKLWQIWKKESQKQCICILNVCEKDTLEKQKVKA